MVPRGTEVPGRDVGAVKLYTLSTCVWCKKMKRFLSSLGIGYVYIDVDTLEAADQKDTKDEIRRWNSKCTFPTMVVDERECVVGHNETKAREVLGL
jgi:glutaredoxin